MLRVVELVPVCQNYRSLLQKSPIKETIFCSVCVCERKCKRV